MDNQWLWKILFWTEVGRREIFKKKMKFNFGVVSEEFKV